MADTVTLVLCGLVFAALVAGVWFFERVQRSRVQRRVSERAPLSDDEFGALYFTNWSKAAATVRRVVGQVLCLDMTRTRPSDRFVQDLRMDDIDSLASVEIVIKIEDELGVRISDDEAERIVTIGQLVDCVISKLDTEQRPQRTDHN
jgi:acyl carrier protein